MEKVAKQDINVIKQLSPIDMSKSGVVLAQHALGDCYQDGTGVEENPAIAMHWHSIASDNGSGPAATGPVIILECFI